MARKKKEREIPTGASNPYFGKYKDESQMAKHPFFTWIFTIPGFILGVFIGIRTGELLLGPLFGAIMGIAIGSLLDKWLEKRREKKKDPD